MAIGPDSLIQSLKESEWQQTHAEDRVVAIHAEMLLSLIQHHAPSARYLKIAWGLTDGADRPLLWVTALNTEQGSPLTAPSPLFDLYYPSQAEYATDPDSAVRLTETSVSRALTHLLGQSVPESPGYDWHSPQGYDRQGDEHVWYDLLLRSPLSPAEHAERLRSPEVAVL
jgi:hypothetical protein